MKTFLVRLVSLCSDKLSTNEEWNITFATKLKIKTLRPRILEELNRMEKLGVVTLITEPKAWVSSLVKVVKPSKIRLCVDQ